jgi:hypothetical protein
MRRFALLLGALAFGHSVAARSISATNRYAWGANVGWLDFRVDATNGASLGLLYCTGHLWSANCGWISLGQCPTNGHRYSNTSANDWGVNHDGRGRLRGLAYGANIGWVAFESNGNPRVDLLTGALDGHAYAANVGWISLSNGHAFVQTDYLATGPDADLDGIPDPWERATTGSLTNLGGGISDRDADGVPDTSEYLADTDPLDAASTLRVVALARTGATDRVAWNVQPTRLYRLDAGVTLDSGWMDSGLGLLPPGAGSSLTGAVSAADVTGRFYRAAAVVPLSP